MDLENLGFDALEPQRLGRFWEAALGCETLTDEPDIFETRLSHPDGTYLDLCLPRVPEPPADPLRLHLDLRGPLLELLPEDEPKGEPKGEAKNRLHIDVRLEPGDDPDAVARGITERGGRRFEHDWSDLPWRVYADGSGNEFCVLPAPG